MPSIVRTYRITAKARRMFVYLRKQSCRVDMTAATSTRTRAWDRDYSRRAQTIIP